jgi:hypothetical protein
MKTLAVLLALALLLPAASAAPGELAPDTLRRAKLRIETLLGNRRGAPPVTTSPANPFTLPQAAAPTEPAPVVPNDAPVTKADVLTRLASSLTVSGYVQIQGVPHLIINRQAYHEDDLVPIRDSNGSVTFVRLKKISAGDFTLELDDIEITQKHTVK